MSLKNKKKEMCFDKFTVLLGLRFQLKHSEEKIPFNVFLDADCVLKKILFYECHAELM